MNSTLRNGVVALASLFAATSYAEPKDGGMADATRPELTTFVKANLKPVSQCYETELAKQPTLAGKVVVKFTITPAKKPVSVEIKDNTLPSPGADAVGTCIKAAVSAWVFPFAVSEDTTVHYPFVFSPASKK